MRSASWTSLASWRPSSEEEAGEWLATALHLCRDDPAAFNALFLCGPPFWSGEGREIDGRPVMGQVEWSKALVEYRSVAIETGNALGKDFWVGRIVPWWLYTRPGGLVIVTGPGQTVLGSVTWKEIRRAIDGFEVDGVSYKPCLPLGAKLSAGIKTSPLTVDLSDGGGWQALGYSTTTVERLSGQHHANLLVIVEEASGAEDVVWEAIDGLVPTKLLAIGNPIRPDGGFVRLCLQGEQDEKNEIPKRKAVKYINTPSTASPHAGLEHSPYGLASLGWIEAMYRKWGKASLWCRAHIHAIRPKLSSEILIQPEWLERAISSAAEASAAAWRKARKAGKRRIACDVGEGVGNARSVVVVRDDVGILEVRADAFGGAHETAGVIAELMHKWSVEACDVSYDAAGTTGAKMKAALPAKHVVGAVPYFGGRNLGKRFGNMRSAAAAAFARRLDPDSYIDGKPNDRPFHIPSHPDLDAILDELRELRGQLKGDRYCLEDKADFMERLGRSPDFCDAITQSFREEAILG